MANPCQVARNRLTRYVAGLNTNTVSKIGTALKAGFVGGIVTPMRGLAGNGSWAGFRMIAGQPLQAGVDMVESTFKSAATGFKVHPREFREVVNGTTLEGLKAFKRGFGAGAGVVKGGWDAGVARGRAMPPGTSFAERIAEGVEELQTHLTADVNATVLEHPLVRFEHPIGRTLVDGAFAAVEVVDRPFYKAAAEMSIYMQARLAAVRAGAKGSARDDIIKRLMAAPTPDMEVRSLMDAQYATFKDKNQMSKGAEALRRMLQQAADAKPKSDGSAHVGAAQLTRAGAKVGMLGMDLVVPFTGVPSSVAAKAMGMTPLGILSPRVRAGQANRSLALAHALLGSGGIALGMKLFDEGLLTGSFTQSERADNTDVGRTEYSLKVGNGWVPLKTLGPVASSLFIGVALRKARDKAPEQGLAGDVGTIIASAGKQTVENSYLQNVKSGIDAIQSPDTKGENLLASLMPVPSILGQTGRALDAQPREARTVGEKLLNRTPASFLLKPALTPTGDRATRTAGERVSSLLNPLGYSKDRDTPERAALRRHGINIGMPQRTMQVDKARRDISREEYRAIVKRQGDIILPIVQEVIASREYKISTPLQQKEWLAGIVRRGKQQAKDPTRDAFRNEPDDDDEQ